jgi:hypothetical protein
MGTTRERDRSERSTKVDMRSIPTVRPPSYLLSIWWPVLFAAIVAGCGGPSVAPTRAPSAEFDRPEEALSAFAEAWNARDVDRLVNTFTPGRRPAVREIEADLRRRTDEFRVVRPRIHTVCHPRGPDWTTAEVYMIQRESNERSPPGDREIVWLRLQRRAWWMYSL